MVRREQREEEERRRKQEESGVNTNNLMSAEREDIAEQQPSEGTEEEQEDLEEKGTESKDSEQQKVEEQEDEQTTGTMEFNFEEDLFVNGKRKEHMTRSQKRKNKHTYFRADEELKQTLPSKETLIKLQEADEDIQKLVREINTRGQFLSERV